MYMFLSAGMHVHIYPTSNCIYLQTGYETTTECSSSFATTYEKRHFIVMTFNEPSGIFGLGMLLGIYIFCI